jgi:preprotein translocase subunit SecF
VSTEITDVTVSESGAGSATSNIDLATGQQRRGAFGRLYHGETSIDFYGRRWWGLGLSIVLIAVTVVSLVFNGLNLGIDFEGGVAWSMPAPEGFTVEDARGILEDHGLDADSAKILERTNASGASLLVQVSDQPLAKVEEMRQAFAEEIGVDVAEVSTTSVSSTWGRNITEKAIRALVVFIVFVAAFISWRMEWKMAGSAIAAMIHDVLISIGVYSVFGFEVTPASVVAFLTILGFSLYDTIVVFDKVKENTERFQPTKAPYGDIVNVSMNQVLMRSLNTTIAALLPVLSLLILGSGVMGAVTLRDFSLALTIGLLTGAYSSIFIATPLLAMWKRREPRWASRGGHATGVELERLVLGAMPTTRQRARRQASVGDVAVAPPPTPSAPSTPEAVLTHAPRPRKKRRREN